MGTGQDLVTQFGLRDITSGDVVHSSTYATAQSGSRIGAMSTETFATRKSTDQHRQIVQGYDKSSVAYDRVHEGQIKRIRHMRSYGKNTAERSLSQQQARRADMKKRFDLGRNNPQFSAPTHSTAISPGCRPNIRPNFGPGGS